jgi:hypothetical protein
MPGLLIIVLSCPWNEYIIDSRRDEVKVRDALPEHAPAVYYIIIEDARRSRASG